MTENTAPFAEPALEADTSPRMHRYTARWRLGEPKDHGVQKLAVLLVTHHKGYGFRATVSNRDAETQSGHPIETYDPHARTVILVVRADRYSAKGLRDAYLAALPELRRRVQDGDEKTASYFTELS